MSRPLFSFSVLLLFFTGCSPRSNLDSPITLDELEIEVHGTSREVAYTNKQAGTFYTETNGEHRSAWQGWYVMAKEIMEDYKISINGRDLLKSEATLAFVYPHQIRRAYPTGVQESVTLLDSSDAIVVELNKVRAEELAVSPVFSDARGENYVMDFRDSVLLVANERHLKRNDGEDYPVWIGVEIVHSPVLSMIRRFHSSSPSGLKSAPGSSLAIVFAAGNSKEETILLSHRIANHYTELIRNRKQRMEEFLNRGFVRTDHERFDKALHWAMISMDALMMNQVKKGIFAGLPWFNNYWGRDTFISLKGATLVSGRFDEAREILRSFGEWQQKDSRSEDYGRIPNQVTTTSISYNTADGTPRFIMALDEYGRYSGDTTFLREMYPVVRRAIEGTLKYHVDRNMFLTHADAETWMDAVGPEGPWSPRGNRANDIQGLWMNQLRASCRLARVLGHSDDERRWRTVDSMVLRNFMQSFVPSGGKFCYDHLNEDGSPDLQIRPNQMFVLDMLLDKPRDQIFKNVTKQLVYMHGVASLSQDDENFHPYHHFEPHYVQDAAYHNGIVWTWLSGTWIDHATRSGFQDLAFEVTENMVHQILDRGAVGTLSELVDAVPRPGEPEPRLSGAFSQAWSLAEFIRNAYQSYLGVSVEKKSITLFPKLPSSIRHAVFNVPLNGSVVRVSYESSTSRGTISVTAGIEPIIVATCWQFEDGTVPDKSPNLFVHMRSGENRRFSYDKASIPNVTGGAVIDAPFTARQLGRIDNLELAVPIVREGLKAMKGPTYRLLNNREVKTQSPQASILYDVDDPIGDDTGTGSYTYPQTPNLKSGSLDITHFTVSADSSNMYFTLRFRNLSNPGWHPEYGFQLTYAAISIDQDGRRGSGGTTVGMNSNYRIDERYAYERLIYVGGGFRVIDAKGKTLAEYLPAPGDEAHPLGSIQSKEVEFAVPVDILGLPNKSWRYTVLVGAQDDHGGSGIGEFRSVESRAGEWMGGGKKKRSDPNVYDYVYPEVKSWKTKVKKISYTISNPEPTIYNP